MRILLAPAHRDGCRFYRMDLPGGVLKRQGCDIQIRMDYLFQTVRQNDLDGNSHVVGLQGDVPFDLVVFQRPMRRHVLELMHVLQARNVAVVVELDDSFHDLAHSHPAWQETHPANDPDKNRDWLLACTQQADWVTVTTPYLAERYASHGRVSVIPNYLPKSALDIKIRHNHPVRLGWAGSVATHVGDLRMTGGSVQAVMDESNAMFGVVGTGEGVQQQLGLRAPPMATGWVPIDRYLRSLAQFDIGITPHKLTRFGSAKSFLKPLEMASVGVPAVMSPIPAYRDLHDYGIGLLAHNADEWREHLLMLATDQAKRERMSKEGREIVREHFLIENNAYRWLQPWADAIAHRETEMLVRA